MINYHVPTSPVYVGPYHQFDSMSSSPSHVGSTPMPSFQGVSYQADASRSLGVPTKGTNVHTDSSHPIQSQADAGRSSYFCSLMTHVDYPSQTDGTVITTPSNAVCSSTPLSQEQASMDYHDSHVSSSPVHAIVSATTASYIYTNDHLQFNSQSTSVQSESLHSHEHISIHEEKCNLEYKQGCSESNLSTTDTSSHNANNLQHASSSEQTGCINPVKK